MDDCVGKRGAIRLDTLVVRSRQARNVVAVGNGTGGVAIVFVPIAQRSSERAPLVATTHRGVERVRPVDDQPAPRPEVGGDDSQGSARTALLVKVVCGDRKRSFAAHV